LINFTPHDALNKPFLFNKTLSEFSFCSYQEVW